MTEKERKRKYYLKNRSALIARQHAYYLANREASLAYCRNRRLTKAARVKEVRQKSYAKHRVKYLVRAKERTMAVGLNFGETFSKWYAAVSGVVLGRGVYRDNRAILSLLGLPLATRNALLTWATKEWKPKYNQHKAPNVKWKVCRILPSAGFIPENLYIKGPIYKEGNKCTR